MKNNHHHHPHLSCPISTRYEKNDIQKHYVQMRMNLRNYALKYGMIPSLLSRLIPSYSFQAPLNSYLTSLYVTDKATADMTSLSKKMQFRAFIWYMVHGLTLSITKISQERISLGLFPNYPGIFKHIITTYDQISRVFWPSHPDRTWSEFINVLLSLELQCNETLNALFFVHDKI